MLHFNFGSFKTTVYINPLLPGIDDIICDLNTSWFKPLLICDSNTFELADKIRRKSAHLQYDDIPIITLTPGESNKNWQAIEKIIRCAHDAGIGKDGVFIGIGGGVVTDLCSFAASIYMRGCSLVLIPTTLLGMLDAGLGGKTGFNLFGIKNLAGTFYPAGHVYIPVEALTGLPPAEWKSGMAELIKMAILDNDDDFLDELASIAEIKNNYTSALGEAALMRFIARALQFKGRIVEEDPLEKGNRRILLNLGHSFGHALESAAGPGKVSHGEAVAWGIARSCELGMAIDICPQTRAIKIKSLLDAFTYETAAPHPLVSGSKSIINALCSDKKTQNGNPVFIVPDKKSAIAVTVPLMTMTDTITGIISGTFSC